MCRRPSFIRRFSASFAVAMWPTKQQQLSTAPSTSHHSISASASANNDNGGIIDSTSSSSDHLYESHSHEKVYLPAKSIAVAFALCITLPFLIGYFGPLLVLRGLGVVPIVCQGTIMSSSSVVTVPKASNEHRLPIPTVYEGKHVPLTLYTSKMFPSAGSATSNTVQIDRSSSAFQVKNKISDSNVISPNVSNQQDIVESSFGIGEKGEESIDNPHNSDFDGHLPAGQHLLVDIKNVDSEFLNSEHRLAAAMVELITESQLTLLSYHCQ